MQVINGGVFGYGLDQTVLRIPRLLRNEIQQVIVSLIPEDIHRMRFSFLFGLQKPFFSLKGDELLVGNTPVPQSPFPSALVKGIPQFLFNSALVNFGVRRILPEGSVLRSQFATPVVQDEVDEEKVYCALLKRIELSVGGRPVTLLIQSSHDLARGRDTMEKLAACTRGSGFSIVDVIPELESLRTRDWKQYEGLFRGHLTAAGNAWVAERVAASLSTTSALP
ncbi:MAG: hypothetical protein HYR96_02950 [Deltaproteobacteria bacterium]|nr:hypothetical protein [Deltaproteobacteria bacterium]